MTPGFDFGAYLDRSQGSALPPTNRLLNRIRLDVHIVTTPELQMQTSSVRLSGDADLHLRGTAGKPVILGRADIIEGEVYFNGTKYSLERGDVTFINPVTTTPVLDLQATTRIRDYDVTLNLNGQIDRPSVTYRSEPPLPTSDIIGLLGFWPDFRRICAIESITVGVQLGNLQRHPQRGSECHGKQPGAEALRRQPHQDRSPGPDHGNLTYARPARQSRLSNRYRTT